MTTLPVLSPVGWLNTETDIHRIAERLIAYYYTSDKDQSICHSIYSFSYLYLQHASDPELFASKLEDNLLLYLRQYLTSIHQGVEKDPVVEIKVNNKNDDNMVTLQMYLSFNWMGKEINFNWLIRSNQAGQLEELYQSNDQNVLVKVLDRINCQDQEYGEYR